jgi:beta-glucosidase-like glycosyl hydrolase
VPRHRPRASRSARTAPSAPTIYPHNIGLGSTRDPALVSRIGHAVAQEVRATGIRWNFALCVCVTRDERRGRSYDSFGETPALVVPMTSIIDGLQGTGSAIPKGCWPRQTR